MKALILAAGYATRLYPLTKKYPKPLLLVKGRPIIDYIVDKLEVIPEIDEIFVVTNSKFISKFRAWRKSIKIAKKITLVDDLTKSNDDRLGAIGDLDFVIKKRRLRDDILVIGGDNLFNAKLNKFVLFSRNNSFPVIGAYDIKDKKKAGKYGVVKIDKNNRLVEFQEKPKKPKSSLVAMCLYYFPGDKLGLVDEYRKSKTSKTDATGFYIDWLRKRVGVSCFVFGGEWFDIGDFNYYDKAKETFKQ
ncbi:MAG: nucleotidyltransferase family protein [Candidatus Omnitrophica bacterium]|jgi:glucose-1-phosphate thymidylyltransferase|nr:nucleotidyltransferase family protein [Candidatus Omnitrophota bacterium]